MSILLDDKEIEAIYVTNQVGNVDDMDIVKATGKQILIKLQAIYNLPDGGAEDKRMGEFLQELQEEVK